MLALFGGNPEVTLIKRDDRWPKYLDDDLEALLRYARRGAVSYDLDKEPVRSLEQLAAEQFGAEHCLAVSSGTAALHCAFFALGVGPGDEVLCPNYTFYRTVTPLVLHGGIPVLIDSEPELENIDGARLERFITPTTRGIVVTHMMGHPCDLEGIWEVARNHGLWVVEDASHAHGARFKDMPIGSGPSDAVCFSLQGKKIVAAGQGGLLCTPHLEVFERALLLAYFRPRLREDASSREYEPYLDSGFGLNYQIHPLGAVLARCHLERLSSLVSARQASCNVLRDGLRGLSLVRPPHVKDYVGSHSWYRFRPIFVGGPNQGIDIELYAKALQAEGVPVRCKRDRLLHEEAMFNGSRRGRPSFAAHLTSALVLRDDYGNSVKLAENTLEIDFPVEPRLQLLKQYINAFHKVDQELRQLASRGAGRVRA